MELVWRIVATGRGRGGCRRRAKRLELDLELESELLQRHGSLGRRHAREHPEYDAGATPRRGDRAAVPGARHASRPRTSRRPGGGSARTATTAPPEDEAIASGLSQKLEPPFVEARPVRHPARADPPVRPLAAVGPLQMPGPLIGGPAAAVAAAGSAPNGLVAGLAAMAGFLISIAPLGRRVRPRRARRQRPGPRDSSTPASSENSRPTQAGPLGPAHVNSKEFP